MVDVRGRRSTPRSGRGARDSRAPRPGSAASGPARARAHVEVDAGGGGGTRGQPPTRMPCTAPLCLCGVTRSRHDVDDVLCLPADRWTENGCAESRRQWVRRSGQHCCRRDARCHTESGGVRDRYPACWKRPLACPSHEGIVVALYCLVKSVGRRGSQRRAHSDGSQRGPVHRAAGEEEAGRDEGGGAGYV